MPPLRSSLSLPIQVHEEVYDSELGKSCVFHGDLPPDFLCLVIRYHFALHEKGRGRISSIARLHRVVMKGKGLAKCFIFVLISLANVDASSWSETMHNNIGKEEKSLANLSLLEEIGKFSKEVFQILSSDLKAKCLETSEAYMHRTTLALRELLDDEILCNRTSLCFLKSVTDERGCVACRRAVKDLFYQLRQSKIRMRVMEALLEYCEEGENQEENCKETVYRYAPLILDKLEKLKTNDICRVIGFCDDGVAI